MLCLFSGGDGKAAAAVFPETGIPELPRPPLPSSMQPQQQSTPSQPQNTGNLNPNRMLEMLQNMPLEQMNLFLAQRMRQLQAQAQAVNANTPAHPPSVTHTKPKGQLATSPTVGDNTASPHSATPVTAAAPTPSHLQGSPSTPKSPKTKAPAKPKTQKRRKSNAAPTPAATAEPAAQAATSPAPAQSAPSPAENPLKRQREEDVPVTSMSAPTPSQSVPTLSKKLKTEWDDSRNTEPSKM
jgi:hypothetical protein